MFVKTIASLTLALIVAATPLAVRAQEEQPLNPKQTDAVKKVVREYILSNPEIIAEAIEALREKQRLSAEADAAKALVSRKDEILNDPDSPVAGNPKGDVTVVEFFDYRCPYCKSMVDTLFDTAKADGKVKIVFKEFPILGPDSIFASRAALAARAQKKYEEFHVALMKLRGPMNEASIMKTAAEIGLNVDKLKRDMESPAIEAALKRNIELGGALNVSGTPAFLVGDRIISSYLNAGALKSLYEQARKGGK